MVLACAGDVVYVGGVHMELVVFAGGPRVRSFLMRGQQWFRDRDDVGESVVECADWEGWGNLLRLVRSMINNH